MLKDTKNIKLAKSIGSQVKALNRSFSALTILKKNLNKKSIEFLSDVLDNAAINEDDNYNSITPFFKSVIIDIIKNPKQKIFKEIIFDKHKLK